MSTSNASIATRRDADGEDTDAAACLPADSARGEGRMFSVSASSGQNPLIHAGYNGFDIPVVLNYGSQDSDYFSYDNMSRMTGYTYTVNNTSESGTLT